MRIVRVKLKIELPADTLDAARGSADALDQIEQATRVAGGVIVSREEHMLSPRPRKHPPMPDPAPLIDYMTAVSLDGEGLRILSGGVELTPPDTTGTVSVTTPASEEELLQIPDFLKRERA